MHLFRTSLAATLCLVCVAALFGCTPGNRSAVEGVLVLDEEVALVRGEKVDHAQREWVVDGNATFVVRVDEDDTDVKVTLAHSGAAGIAPATIEVDSNQEGEEGRGIEIAALEAPAGSRLTLSLESGQDLAQPGDVRLKVMRYDPEMAAAPRVAARLDALRAWSAATNAQLSGEDIRKTAFRDIDHALAHLESADGDPALAAWGRVIRSSLNHRQLTNLKVALTDAQQAERGFTALGAARNAARAQLQQSAVLIEIAHDKAAKDPSAEEAARDAKRLLTLLSDDPAMSAFERARALNYRGVLAFYTHEIPEARARFRELIAAYDALGNRRGRLVALGNLGAIATEEGDYRGSAQYYDQIIADIDRIPQPGTRAMLLFNAGRLDTFAGHVDRAIERLLLARELARENKLLPNEARVLHGLGLAYWTRGDTAQAAALLGEALKIRRTLDDPLGLNASLSANGNLAREAGDLRKALAMHREAVSLASSADVRVKALLDLALDQQAASDYPRAIGTAREALAVPVNMPNFYRRYAVKLALADMLLSQPRRTPEAIREATALAQEALDAAVARADTTQEIAGRRLLAQAHAARGATREARAEYEQAIALIFKYRSTINNPELRAVTLAHEQQTFRGYVDLLMRDVARRGAGKLLPAGRDEEDALRTLEWARAINFAEARVSPLDAAAQAKLDELLTQMAGKRVRIAALLERTDDVSRELEVLRLDIAQLRAEVDRLRTTAARDAKVVAASPTVDAPWPALPTGVTQLSYALETERPYLWVRDASGIRVTALAAAPAAITQDLAAFSAAIRARTPERVDELLARLSAILLPAGVIGESSSTLEIVAEGQIAGIPFAALRVSAGNSARVLERQSIVMIDSLFQAQAVEKSTQRRPLGFMALANDARDKAGTITPTVFSPLQSTAAEVSSIATLFQQREPPAVARLLLGDEGSAGNLRLAWQGGVDVVHFATHGLADMRQPLSSLLLRPARDVSGSPSYLTAGQVQEWRGDTDLVYLSACETAVGPARFAEGLPGLQRAFLRAGARSVIATLWPVEDLYAGEFAKDFYRRYTAGTPASQALSQTQRAWMEEKPGSRASEQAFRHMTAWAHVLYAQ